MEYMKSIKINRILNLIILILLITFLILFLTYGTSPCGDCRFNINGEKLKIDEFFNLFREDCLIEEKQDKSELFGLLNVSLE